MKFAAALAALALFASAATAETVTIDSGPLNGTSADGVDKYLGIPYAASPVGPLRWMPPAAPATWSTPRDATAFGAVCPQPPRGDGASARSDA